MNLIKKILISLSAIIGALFLGFFEGRREEKINNKQKTTENAYTNLADHLAKEREINQLSRSDVDDVLRK